jgi:tripartite-type tricarboxylate transporter receptor subunit TctC
VSIEFRNQLKLTVIRDVDKAKTDRLIKAQCLERSPQLADVPTIAEAGYPEVLLGGYMVLHAPAGTPPAIVELLQKEVQSALADKTIQERARRIEVDPVPTTSAEAARLLLEERELMKHLVQSTRMRID